MVDYTILEQQAIAAGYINSIMLSCNNNADCLVAAVKHNIYNDVQHSNKIASLIIATHSMLHTSGVPTDIRANAITNLIGELDNVMNCPLRAGHYDPDSTAIEMCCQALLNM